MKMDLRLLKTEQALFQTLPSSLRADCYVDEQNIVSFEGPDELYLRYRMARFVDPSSKKFVEAVRKAKDQRALEKAIAAFNPADLSRESMAEIFFVLGVRVISAMIVSLLQNAQNTEDLEGIAALTQIRSMLIDANHSTTAS